MIGEVLGPSRRMAFPGFPFDSQSVFSQSQLGGHLLCIFFMAGRADNSYVSKHGYGKSCTCQHAGIERKFQQTPGTYPGPRENYFVYEGNPSFLGDFWDIWGMFQESVSFFLEALIFLVLISLTMLP